MTTTRYIIIDKKDDVYLKIEADADIRRELGQFFTFEVPGFKFMPQFRNRVWDGKIRLFSYQTGQIYVGLYPYILKWCEDNNIQVVDGTKIQDTKVEDSKVDAWIAPVAPDFAPLGLKTTGDYRMNSIWSLTGLPVITIPTGVNNENLPYSLQTISNFGEDEKLLQISKMIVNNLSISKIQNEWDLN